jgi:hypothetical protein
MNRRWWARLFDREDWIRDAVQRGLEAFAREMDGKPTTMHTEECEVEPTPTPTAAPRSTPSFA